LARSGRALPALRAASVPWTDSVPACELVRQGPDGGLSAASSTLNLGNDQREQLPIDGRGALQIDADQIPDANFGAE